MLGLLKCQKIFLYPTFSKFINFQNFDFEKLYFSDFFIKTMLMRSSVLSSNSVTLPDTVHLLSEAEPKIEKSLKKEKHCIFTTSESLVNSLGKWDFGIFWLTKW